MIPSYVPIENTGMSVISALFFTFGGASMMLFGSWVVKRLDKNDTAIQDTNIKLTRIEGNVDTTKEIVQRIENSMSELGRTNAKVIEHLLRNDIRD